MFFGNTVIRPETTNTVVTYCPIVTRWSRNYILDHYAAPGRCSGLTMCITDQNNNCTLIISSIVKLLTSSLLTCVANKKIHLVQRPYTYYIQLYNARKHFLYIYVQYIYISGLFRSHLLQKWQEKWSSFTIFVSLYIS